ncbi:ABC transporter permease [Steroidobacter sp.]|uniref:ABC transporter permease n=1 Tax=Steroidobacter sp. TaxID=1978227 RepID=UPI001A605DDA|nr:FtsX-like permease family protein [Steroidobacter sp.]MBL8266743.1 ABC transporter permease [Steroidobacter sp.]
MRFLPVIWSGLWRKPGRSILIFLQVSVAFALFGVLQGMKSGVEQLISQARADLLLVHSSLGFVDSLPLGALEQIQAVPGVKVVIPVELFGGMYQKPTQGMGIVAIRPDQAWLSVFTYTVAAEDVAAFEKTRTGTLVRKALLEKYGWKIGDRIPLVTNVAKSDGSMDWSFDIVGTYTDSDVAGGTDVILIHYDNFNEARLAGKGNVNHFNVAIAEPRQAATVADAIDRRFTNSSHSTRTESLRELAQLQMQSIGDLGFLIRAIVGAVLVALFFATTTMMMQSIRERTPELAVLKTLGFSNHALFLFVLAEAAVVCVAAAAFGLTLALLAFPFASRFVPGISMPAQVVALGLGCACLVALISAAVPAIRAARLNIVAALASR